MQSLSVKVLTDERENGERRGGFTVKIELGMGAWNCLTLAISRESLDVDVRLSGVVSGFRT